MAASKPPYSEHPLSKEAATRLYNRVSWGIAAALAISVVSLLHVAASKDQQATVYTWVAKWPGWMSEGAKKWTNLRTPGSIEFVVCLILAIVLFTRTAIAGVSPLTKAVRRWSETLAQPDLGVLSQQASDRRFLAPEASDAFFEEREAPLQTLLDLARDDRAYRVVTVHGPSGIGKTRLALAWIEALSEEWRPCLVNGRSSWTQRLHPLAWYRRQWEAGFLQQGQIASLRAKSLTDWRPLRPTAIVLDATEMSDTSWREVEADLATGAEDYLFPVRVLVLSYEQQRFAKGLGDRAAADDETQIALSALSGTAVRSILDRTEAGRRIAVQDAEALLTMTGGVPFLVRMAAHMDDVASSPAEPALPLGRAGGRLQGYATLLLKECGSAALGNEAGVPLLAQHALAIATLAGTLDVDRFELFSLSNLPELIAARFSGHMLRGVEPPLLALAFLHQVDRDGSSATRHRIALRAWQEASAGVARMIRHFWLSVARDNTLAAKINEAGPTLPDPVWFRPYDSLPDDATEAIAIAWFGAMLDVLRSRKLSADDRTGIEARIAQLVLKFNRAADSEILAMWANFLVSQVRERNSNAWTNLEDLYAPQTDPTGIVAQAWAGAAPFAVLMLGDTDPAAAFTLADRVIAADASLVTPLHRARTAAALSFLADKAGRDVLSRATFILAQLDPAARMQSDIGAMECTVAVSAANHYGKAQRWDDLAAQLKSLNDLTGRFPNNQDIQLSLARGADNAAIHYGKAQRWDDLATQLKTLNDLAGRFPDNQGIQLHLGRGAVNAANPYGEAQRWDDLATQLKTLNDLAGRFPDNQDTQLHLAEGAANAANPYGEAQRWDDLATQLKTLNDLAGRFPGNQDIQLPLARGAANAAIHYGKAQRWDDLATQLKTLNDLDRRFPDNHGIQLPLARGVASTTDHYGKAQRWDDLATQLKTLNDLAGRFPDNQDFQFDITGGVANATDRYGEAQHWDDLATQLTVLTDLGRRFPNNQDIQLLLARCTVNAARNYGEAQHWDDLATQLTVLTDLGRRFPNNQDIQLLLARCTVNAARNYGEAQRWDDLATQLTVLTDLDRGFPNNQAIQFDIAGGVANATNAYGEAQRWDDLATQLKTLNDLAGRFPDNQDIQLHLGRGALNAASDYGKAQRWDDLATQLKTLTDLDRRFPDNQDTQLKLAMGTANAASDYGKAQRWDDLATQLKTLNDLAGRFPDNQDIQLPFAKGAANAAIHYGKAQRWDDLATQLKTLNDLAGRFPDNRDTQFWLATGAAAAVISASSPTALRRSTLTVIAGVSLRHPEDLQIQALAHGFGLTASEQITRAVAAAQQAAQAVASQPSCR